MAEARTSAAEVVTDQSAVEEDDKGMTRVETEGAIESLPHYKTGIPSDGIVYRDDQGQRVKLDTNGKPSLWIPTVYEEVWDADHLGQKEFHQKYGTTLGQFWQKGVRRMQNI